MRLAQLVYEIVKESIDIPSGMTLEGFVEGLYDSDRDFSSQISSVFYHVNLAFARLFTERKTRLSAEKEISSPLGEIDASGKEITAVVDKLSPEYSNVSHKQIGDSLWVEKGFIGKPLYVESRARIPHFSLASIRKEILEEDDLPKTVEVEIELEAFGITDELCAYVKEFCKGGLLEYMSPELSARHSQLAESYFSRLETFVTRYPIHRIRNTWGIC